MSAEITRRSLADDLDADDTELDKFSSGNADRFKAYRAQLSAEGVSPQAIKARLPPSRPPTESVAQSRATKRLSKRATPWSPRSSPRSP